MCATNDARVAGDLTVRDTFARTLSASCEIKLPGGTGGDASLCIQGVCSTAAILRARNCHGYIEMGPVNTAFAHVQTDRNRFYFNKCVIVDSGVVESYNDDLVLKSSYTGSACDIVFKTGSNERARIGASNGAATFCCSVNVCGTLSKCSGCFDIVHPLPALSSSKRLSHSFVESPQADNIYSGVVQLTAGKATVNIDSMHGMTNGTLTALNRCFRTFTTNETNWDPVKGSVSGNTLTVESCVTNSNATVSWMVLGERHDIHMYENPNTDNDGRVRVEYDA